jgi:hypothetical protein
MALASPPLENRVAKILESRIPQPCIAARRIRERQRLDITDHRDTGRKVFEIDTPV